MQRQLTRRIPAIVLVAFSLLAAYSPIAASSGTSTRVILGKIRDTWVEDLRTKQIEHILKLYASDAVFHQPTGEQVAGSAALRALFQTVMATFDSDLTLHSRNLETSGDLAYDSGDFSETLTTIATGAKITAKGSYLIIYKRQKNGSWLIVQQVFTGTPPSAS